MKIYIIGGPGSGKTTYAKKLSAKWCIPHFDLDEIKWVNGGSQSPYNQKRSPEERTRLLNDILTQNNHWICEGVYFQDWIMPVIQQADIVLILQTSTWIRQYRIIKRSFRRLFHFDPPKYKETPLTLFRLLRWSQVYDTKYLPQALAKITAAKTKYHIVKRRKK